MELKSLKIFEKWFNKLDGATYIRVLARLEQIRINNNLGDYKNIGDGVFELRLHFGPGYRIYFGKDGRQLILLLCGGDKSNQDKDIEKAKKLWKEYLADN